MENLELPANFVSDITTNATGMISAFSPYITMIVGVLLGALVITMIIGSIKK